MPDQHLPGQHLPGQHLPGQALPGWTLAEPAAPRRAALFADVPHLPGAAKPDPILLVDHVSRTFGGLKAVDVEHLEIQRGCITGLIGPNGAGKTTLFNLLTGFDRPDTGTWTLDGRPLSRLHPHRVARQGMVRTAEIVWQVISDLNNFKHFMPRMLNSMAVAPEKI